MGPRDSTVALGYFLILPIKIWWQGRDAEDMAQYLRALAVPPKSPSSVTRAHTKQFITAR